MEFTKNVYGPVTCNHFCSTIFTSFWKEMVSSQYNIFYKFSFSLKRNSFIEINQNKERGVQDPNDFLLAIVFRHLRERYAAPVATIVIDDEDDRLSVQGNKNINFDKKSLYSA